VKIIVADGALQKVAHVMKNAWDSTDNTRSCSHDQDRMQGTPDPDWSFRNTTQATFRRQACVD
jgi:hypothetical protein